jgi:hypothetical protein
VPTDSTRRVCGPEDGKARGDLVAPGLQEVVLADGAARRLGRRLQDGKDGADGEIDIDVARAVDRVEQEQVFAPRVAVGDEVDGLHLLRRHGGEVAAPLVGLQERLVGDHVELLLHLALDVLGVEIAEHAAERALVDRMADGLAGARHDLDQQAQLGGQGGLAALLFDEELGQGLAMHGNPVSVGPMLRA